MLNSQETRWKRAKHGNSMLSSIAYFGIISMLRFQNAQHSPTWNFHVTDGSKYQDFHEPVLASEREAR